MSKDEDILMMQVGRQRQKNSKEAQERKKRDRKKHNKEQKWKISSTNHAMYIFYYTWICQKGQDLNIADSILFPLAISYFWSHLSCLSCNI